MSVLLAIFAVLVLTPLAFAQELTIHFQKAAGTNARKINSVSAIAQDANGLIWLGSYEGLYHYDGFEFEQFTHDPGDDTTLSNNIVSALLIDSQQQLWVGTWQGGLNRYQANQRQFRRYQPIDNQFDSLGDIRVFALTEDSAGQIWIGTASGLDVYLPDSDSFAHFQHNPIDRKSIQAGSIVSVAAGENQELWVASRRELTRFDPEEQSFTRIPLNPGSRAPTIAFVKIAPDQSIWVGTEDQGIFYLDRDGELLEQFNSSNQNSMVPDRVTDIVFEASQRVWIASRQGIVTLGSDNQARWLRSSNADPLSLGTDRINALYLDPHEVLWVGGTGSGLEYFDTRQVAFSRLIHDALSPTSLSAPLVWDLARQSDGQLLVATSAGLNRFNAASGELQQLDQLNRAIAGGIQALEISADQSVLIGTSDGRVLLASADLSDFQELSYLPAASANTNRAPIQHLLTANDGSIWVVSRAGLSKLDQRGALRAFFTDALFFDADESPNIRSFPGSSLVHSISEDEAGNLWLGTWGAGLVMLNPTDGSHRVFRAEPGNSESLPDDTIRSLFMDPDGSLWVGTQNGLSVLSSSERLSETYNFSNYFERDGLPNNVIHGISAVNDTIWVTTNNGLGSLDKSTQSFARYGSEYGLPSEEFIDGALVSNGTDTLYFGSANGVVIYREAMSRSAAVAQPILTSVKVNNRPQQLAGQVTGDAQLELTHDQNDVGFEFSLNDLSQVRQAQFNYRLLPYEQDWRTISGSNLLNYTNLDPGRYQLELKLADSSVTQYPFTIAPPLWKTTWAYMFYALLVGLAIAAFYRHHKNKLAQAKVLHRNDVLKETYRRLEKYFPDPLIERILTERDTAAIKAKRKLVTVLFADLARFTRFSDQFEPEVVTRVINEFITSMSELVKAHHGVLNEVLGDGVVVLFGSPGTMSSEEQARNAVNLARAMSRKMAELGERWESSGVDFKVQLKIGIHQDYATIGSFGSDNFMVYRAVGSVTNLASRIQSLAEPGQVLVTYPVFVHSKAEQQFAAPRNELFKGYQQAYKIYQLLDK